MLSFLFFLSLSFLDYLIPSEIYINYSNPYESKYILSFSFDPTKRSRSSETVKV